MSAQIVGSCREWSLSLRRKFRGVAQAALVLGLGGLLTFSAGCDRVESCEYRCTQEQNACPVGLTCDITLGYCVSEGYAGTCDAETREVTVCKNEPVELELPDEAPSDPNDIEGLLNAAAIEDGKLKTTFGKKTVLAFGDPNQTRQYWQVDVSDDCPVVDATLPPLCVGETLSQTLAVKGGEGDVEFELLEEDMDFSLSRDGLLEGKASVAGNHELRIVVTDERGLRTVRSATVAIASDCPDVGGLELPSVCAGSGYEYELDLLGRSPIEILDLTTIEKDGEQLTSAEAKRWESELKLAYRENGSGYLLSAAPEPSALGEFTLNFTLKNEISIAKQEVVLTVASCNPIPSDFTACAGTDFDFDLQGTENDEWGFYVKTDALSERVFFAGNRLRGNLEAGHYEVRAGVKEPPNPATRLATLKLTVLSSETTACQPVENSTEEPDAGPVELSDAGDQSSSPPEPPPPLPQLLGCVAENVRYATAVPLPAATTWSVVDGELPLGLRLESDLIVGSPTSSQQGSFVIEARAAGGVRVQQKHLFTIQENCYYAFKTLRQSTVIRLMVGHVLQSPAAPVEALSAVELGTADADLFAFDPTGNAIAFTTYEPNTGETKAYVGDISVTNLDHDLLVDVTPLPLFPLNSRVLELNWSDAGDLAMILEGVGTNDPLERRIVTFSETAPQDWQVVVDDDVAKAHSLEWLGSDVCLIGSADPNSTGVLFNYLFCKSNSGETKSWAGPAFDFADDMRIRASSSTSTLLAMAPVPDEGDLANNMDFVLGVDASNALWSAVTHRGVYASPRGDMVAAPQEDGSLDLVAPATPTDDPDLVSYSPIASLPSCDIVVAWSPETGALACVPANDETHVTIATFDNHALKDTFVVTIPGHELSTQRVFVDDRFYVLDAGWGKLRVVVLKTTPSVADLEVGSATPTLMGLLPMPKLGAHSRVAVQTDGKLLAVNLDEESATEISVAAATLPNAGPCTWSFHLSGYPNWCGGGETSRVFQMSFGASNFFYLDDSGKLHLSNALGDTIVSNAQCGSALNCSGEFAFGR